jgi:adenosylcobinamide-phosphate synthase
VYPELTLVAYVTDRLFGEFSFIRHPVIIMGDFIKWFEKYFYKDTISRGALLTLLLLFFVFIVSFIIDWIVTIWVENIILKVMITGLIASTTIASKMLYESVKNIIIYPKSIKYLVSRDTEELSSSDINKAAIETYAENLSDGVVAPLFYLYFFGLEGALIYKAINTLDSMVGYRNKYYENFGKFSAKLDDVANYIPSRITALLIAILTASKKALYYSYHYGKYHESPNAGYPISAMALAIGVKLGGNSSYFGKIKFKPYFGVGREVVVIDDISKALSFQLSFDIFIIIFLGVIIWV